jgi:hypothetical protein
VNYWLLITDLWLFAGASIGHRNVAERILDVLAASSPSRLGAAVAGDLLAHGVTPLEDF